MNQATERIETTVVGSYPVPDWLVASPTEQALDDATRAVFDAFATGKHADLEAVATCGRAIQNKAHAAQVARVNRELTP